VERQARLGWVPVARIKIPPHAQRAKINRSRVHEMAADFDLEQLGTPTVSEHDDWYFVLDGTHRIEALKEHGYGDQSVPCWVYRDLTAEDESEKFLKLNDTLTVTAFDRFLTGINAGRAAECEIDQTVRSQGLVISKDKVVGAIKAVSTLRKVYFTAGPVTLGWALRIIRDAYGDPGFEAVVIEGLGLLCQRYNGRLPDEETVSTKLGAAYGGVNGLLNKAANIRRETGNQKALCVAAAAVEILNGSRGGPKLPSWWKS
jgi:hypothetical protein